MSSLIDQNRKGIQYLLLGGVFALLVVIGSVRLVAAVSGNVTADLVLGQIDFNNNSPSISNSQLNVPIGVAIDRGALSNYLYVVDAGNNRVLGWTLPVTSGVPANLVIGQQGFTTSYSGAGLGALDEPGGDAVDLSGNLFVADTGNSRVLLFSAPYQFSKVPCTVSTPCVGQSAGVVIGQPVTTTASGNLCNQGNKTMPSATSLCNPASVAVDGDGNLYVADTGNSRVLEFFDPTGPANPNCPVPGSPGCPGDLVADIVLGQGTTGNSFNTNACGLDNASMCKPTGVAIDSIGNVYVSDSGNNRVLELNQGDFIANQVYGQSDFTTNTPTGGGGNPATANGLNLPSGVTLDANDNLYVVDSNNNRILTFAPLTNPAGPAGPPAIVVFGQGTMGNNFVANSCAAGTIGLCYENASLTRSPGYVAFDSSADLFAVDSLNSRVLEYLAPVITLSTPTMTPIPATPTATPSIPPTPTATPTPSGQIKLSPMAVKFQEIKVGKTAKRKITITNQADSELIGTVEPAIAAPFSLEQATGFELTRHQKKEFFVLFEPTQPGTASSADITIMSSDLSNSPMIIPVTGKSKQ